MRYNKEEYKNLALELNLNKSKKSAWISSVVGCIVVLITIFVLYKDLYFAIIISLFSFGLMHYIIRKLITDAATKSNFLNDIAYIDQTIDEDKIVEVTVRDNYLESKGEYNYKDISFVKEDKKNYYLYLNSTMAIIVSKSKLEKEENFRNILKTAGLLKNK